MRDAQRRSRPARRPLRRGALGEQQLRPRVASARARRSAGSILRTVPTSADASKFRGSALEASVAQRRGGCPARALRSCAGSASGRRVPLSERGESPEMPNIVLERPQTSVEWPIYWASAASSRIDGGIFADASQWSCSNLSRGYVTMHALWIASHCFAARRRAPKLRSASPLQVCG